MRRHFFFCVCLQLLPWTNSPPLSSETSTFVKLSDLIFWVYLNSDANALAKVKWFATEQAERGVYNLVLKLSKHFEAEQEEQYFVQQTDMLVGFGLLIRSQDTDCLRWQSGSSADCRVGVSIHTLPPVHVSKCPWHWNLVCSPGHWRCTNTNQCIPVCRSWAQINGKGCNRKGIWYEKPALNQICRSSVLKQMIRCGRPYAEQPRWEGRKDYNETKQWKHTEPLGQSVKSFKLEALNKYLIKPVLNEAKILTVLWRHFIFCSNVLEKERRRLFSLVSVDLSRRERNKLSSFSNVPIFSKYLVETWIQSMICK